MRAWFALALFAVLASAQPKRVLYVTHSAGFVHGSIAVSHRVLADLARTNGRFEVVSTEDLSFFDADRLNQFDAVFFFTSGELPLTDTQKRNLLEFVRGGKGFGGAHSATDTLYRWPEYGDLIGGYFDGHPWTQEVGIDVEDPDHPATRPLGSSFRLLEEIYQFRSWSRDSVRVLMTLDTRTVDLKLQGVNRTDGDFALAWCRPYGNGRVFYTALGHFDETWLDVRFQKMLEGALLWLVGGASGDARPRKVTPAVARVSNLAFDSADAVAPGMLASITGSGLSNGSTMLASSLPLPLKLAGTEVKVNGVSVPLVSVSPDRVVAHLPEGLDAPAPVTVVAGSTESGPSRTVRVEAAVPGILGITRSGQVISIYATGLGREQSVEVRAGEHVAAVEYFGPAPGFVGISQINARLPESAVQTYQVTIRAAGRDSNALPGPG
jgi:type 1 glutamine amidotransferase